MTITQINEICSVRFGCGVLAVDPLTALWLAEFILTEHNLNVFKKISSYRNKFGKGTTFPSFGSPTFATV